MALMLITTVPAKSLVGVMLNPLAFVVVGPKLLTAFPEKVPTATPP